MTVWKIYFWGKYCEVGLGEQRYAYVLNVYEYKLLYWFDFSTWKCLSPCWWRLETLSIFFFDKYSKLIHNLVTFGRNNFVVALNRDFVIVLLQLAQIFFSLSLLMCGNRGQRMWRWGAEVTSAISTEAIISHSPIPLHSSYQPPPPLPAWYGPRQDFIALNQSALLLKCQTRSF